MVCNSSHPFDYAKSMNPARVIRALAVMYACLASQALAYNRETHFDLTLYLALKAPCLEFADAALVASADWSQDTNQTTVAERDFFRVIVQDVPSQRNWHAFETPEVVRARKDALWARIEQSDTREERMIHLGQLLHFAQDSFSHAGYAPGLGHAVDTFTGHDPDSFAFPDRGPQALNRMLETARETLGWFSRACTLLGAGPVNIALEDRDLTLFRALIAGSDPGWRAWRFSGVSDEGLIGERKLYGLIADHLGGEWSPSALTGTADRSEMVNAYLEWLHVAYGADGEPMNLPELLPRLETIRQGGPPPNLPTRGLIWAEIHTGC
jgi:hypothetical protein